MNKAEKIDGISEKEEFVQSLLKHGKPVNADILKNSYQIPKAEAIQILERLSDKGLAVDLNNNGIYQSKESAEELIKEKKEKEQSTKKIAEKVEVEEEKHSQKPEESTINIEAEMAEEVEEERLEAEAVKVSKKKKAVKEREVESEENGDTDEKDSKPASAEDLASLTNGTLETNFNNDRSNNNLEKQKNPKRNEGNNNEKEERLSYSDFEKVKRHIKRSGDPYFDIKSTALQLNLDEELLEDRLPQLVKEGLLDSFKSEIGKVYRRAETLEEKSQRMLAELQQKEKFDVDGNPAREGYVIVNGVQVKKATGVKNEEAREKLEAEKREGRKMTRGETIYDIEQTAKDVKKYILDNKIDKPSIKGNLENLGLATEMTEEVEKQLLEEGFLVSLPEDEGKGYRAGPFLKTGGSELTDTTTEPKGDKSITEQKKNVVDAEMTEPESAEKPILFADLSVQQREWLNVTNIGTGGKVYMEKDTLTGEDVEHMKHKYGESFLSTKEETLDTAAEVVEIETEENKESLPQIIFGELTPATRRALNQHRNPNIDAVEYLENYDKYSLGQDAVISEDDTKWLIEQGFINENYEAVIEDGKEIEEVEPEIVGIKKQEGEVEAEFTEVEESGLNLEALKEDMNTKREAFIKEHQDYIKARKDRDAISRIKSKLGISEKAEPEEDLPESLRTAKAEYNQAQIEYAKGLQEDSLEKLKSGVRFGDLTGEEQAKLNDMIRFSGQFEGSDKNVLRGNDIVPESLLEKGLGEGFLTKEKVDELKLSSNPEQRKGLEKEVKAEVFNKVFLEDYNKRKEAEAESWTPKEKGFLRKGFEKWQGLKTWQKITASSGLLAVGVGASAAGLGSIGAGIILGRSALLAGVSGATFGQLGGKLFEKFVEDNSREEILEKQMDNARKFFVENNVDLESLYKVEERVGRADYNFESAQEDRRVNKMLVMAASGLLGATIVKSIVGAFGGSPDTATPAETVPGSDTITTEITPQPTTPNTTTSTLEAPLAEAETIQPRYPETAVVNPEAFDPTVIDSSSDELFQETAFEAAAASPPIEVTGDMTNAFQALHNTSFDPSSALDVAKMDIMNSLSGAEITGVSDGFSVPSPMVDRVIDSIVTAQGGGSNAWQSIADKLHSPELLEQIKALQERALEDSSLISDAEGQIRNLLRG